MNVSDFQKKWGEPWADLVAGEMFSDALAVIEGESDTLKIGKLTREEVKAHGDIILSRQQGFTELSAGLLTLAARKSFEFQSIQEDYPDAAEEFAESQKTKK